VNSYLENKNQNKIMKKKQLHGELWKVLREVMRIMRLSLFLIVISSAMAFSATSYSQSTKLTLDLNNTTVKEVLKAIEDQSEFLFFYQEKHVDLNRQVTLHATEQDVETILNQVFAGTDNIYVINDRQIIIGVAPRRELEKQMLSLKGDVNTVIEQPQQKEITGKVTDTDGLPLPGVTVIVKGTTIGTVTNADGEFSLNIPLDAEILQFSFVGMKTQEIPIGEQTTFSIIMEEQTIGLEEVVAVGYGVQRKETVTGSISSIESKALVQSPEANISNALAGRMTGLLSVQREGEPGNDLATLRIRGEGTFSGSSDPLVLVDGVESLNFNNIDPHEIENITILKDASATAVFGVRGANGVILITTKRGKVGEPVLSISSNVAVKRFTELRENLGSYEYAIYFNEALKYNSYFTGSYSPMFSEEDIEHFRIGDDPIFHPNTDWYSLMLKPFSLQTQHNVNIQGGSELIKYFVSVGYFSQEGLFNDFEGVADYDANILFKRFNFRSNFDFTITKRLTAKINLSSQLDNKRSPGSGDNVRYTFNRISIAPPYHSPGLVDNKIVNVHDVFGGNPLELLLSGGYNRNLINYLTSSVRFDYKLDYLVEGLSAHALISY
jgi:TonB-linked SusC/RagA family outer membrane protein